MLGRISEFLSNWNPSEPTSPRPTTVNHLPFDATSDQVRRTQTSGKRTETLPVGFSVDISIHSSDVCGLFYIYFPSTSDLHSRLRTFISNSVGGGTILMHGLNFFAFFRFNHLIAMPKDSNVLNLYVYNYARLFLDWV